MTSQLVTHSSSCPPMVSRSSQRIIAMVTAGTAKVSQPKAGMLTSIARLLSTGQAQSWRPTPSTLSLSMTWRNTKSFCGLKLRLGRRQIKRTIAPLACIRRTALRKANGTLETPSFSSLKSTSCHGTTGMLTSIALKLNQ